MKKFIKTTATIMAMTCAFGCVGCGGNNGGGHAGTGEGGSLVIRPFGGGYGTTWLTSIVKEFEKETNINVEVKPAATDTGSWESEIDAGTCSIDLFIDNGSGLKLATKNGLTVKGVKYDTYLADLTDMYNSKVPGEDVLYKDKMFDAVEQYYNFDSVYDYETKTYSEKSETGKYYTTSWGGGTIGLVVNMEKWDSAWGSIPNTTNEMVSLCDKIMASNADKNVMMREYPFVYSLETSYWKFAFENWATQYLGQDGVDAYYNGYDKDGNRFTKELLRYDAFLESLKILETCLMPRGSDGNSGYSHPNSTSINFTEAQFKLLNVGGGIMQPNGNWLISEMAANYANAKTMNIQFMKMPVISSIIDILPDGSVENDAELSALIKAIDENNTALTGTGYSVTQADYDRVEWARKLIITSFGGQGAYIPAYAKNVENAKKFLLYLAKDSSLDIYYKETMGSTMPFTHDYSANGYEASSFIKSEQKLLVNGNVKCSAFAGTKIKFFSHTGFNPLCMPHYHYTTTETYLSAINANDRKTAAEVFDINYQYAVDNWDSAYAPYSWDD